MKLFKKILAMTTLLTLVLSAIPVNAATKKAVDFENGKLTGVSALLTDADSDQCKLSVKKFNGSKALFVDVKDSTKVPKIRIDVKKLVGGSNLAKVRAIKFKLTIVNPEKKAIGWNGGGIGANIGSDGKVWYQGSQWTLEEYKESSKSMEFKEAFVTGMGFTKNAKKSSFLFMKWASKDTTNDMYIDNIQFLDKNGKAIPIKTK